MIAKISSGKDTAGLICYLYGPGRANEQNIEGTRAKLKRLVKLDILTEAETGSFTRKQ